MIRILSHPPIVGIKPKVEPARSVCKSGRKLTPEAVARDATIRKFWRTRTTLEIANMLNLTRGYIRRRGGELGLMDGGAR